MIHPIRHFITITRHRHMVFRHCLKAGIPLRGLLHDLSKYSPTEFGPGCRFYTGTRSPNEGERKAYGHSNAWMHHKGRNRHHFEYWTDYDPISKKVIPIKMPLVYVIEMFCDRVAAGKVYNRKGEFDNSKPLAYFEKGKANRMIHPETSALLEKLLGMLAEEGEKKTFSYIRSLRKNKGY